MRTMLLLWLAALTTAVSGQESESPPAQDQAEVEAPVDDERAAEDAAVEQVLEDAELIYGEDEEADDFIPSQQVSADQLLDYPVDI
jgi:hypothetical protein